LPISIIISTTGLSESNKPAACQLLLGLSLNQVDGHYQMKNMTKPMAIVVSPNKAVQAQHLSLVADATKSSSLTTKTNLETIATPSYTGGIYYKELTL
jgi:hypothetical protein